MSNEESVMQANKQFYNALNAMFTGELAQMEDIWSHADDAILEGPFGGRITGYENIKAEFVKEAGMHLGGTVEPVDILVRAGSDMAMVTCIEAGRDMTVENEPINVRHRATNIFRLEEGEWKMLHHHTDENPVLQLAPFHLPTT